MDKPLHLTLFSHAGKTVIILLDCYINIIIMKKVMKCKKKTLRMKIAKIHCYSKDIVYNNFPWCTRADDTWRPRQIPTTRLPTSTMRLPCRPNCERRIARTIRLWCRITGLRRIWVRVRSCGSWWGDIRRWRRENEKIHSYWKDMKKRKECRL